MPGLNRPLIKACAVNGTTALNANFTAKTAMTATKPSGNYVMDLGSGITPSRIRIYPYGLGSNDDVFSIRLWAWYRLGAAFWLPTMIGEFSCTISTFAGVAGQAVLNTETFADTIGIVATVGEATVTANTTRTGTVQLYSPANNTPAWVELPLRAPELLEFDFDQTTGTPTMNALIQLIDELQF